MKKLSAALCMLFISVIFVSAQNSQDEYKKNEFYVGYSNQQMDVGDRESFNGFEVSYTRNVTRYIGIKGDFSAAFRNDSFRAGIPNPNGGPDIVETDLKRSVYNFLGGVQIKDNATKSRLKPFAHLLVGVGHNRTSGNSRCISNNCAPFIGDFEISDTGFSGAFGGGLDIKINDKIDLRAIQVDYNPIYSNSRVDNNIRIGVGFVFK